MSVLIRGMKMPKSCNECRFAYRGACIANIGREVKVEQICPLIEVQTPHGRLIDADALLNLLNSCMFPSDMVTTRAVSMGINWIKEAPTVIEAEDGEE